MPILLRHFRRFRSFAHALPARVRASASGPAVKSPSGLVPAYLRDPPATQKQRLMAYTLQKGLCTRCPDPLGLRYEVDHIVPRWKGGSSTQANLQALHPACHKVKTKAERPELTEAQRAVKNDMRMSPLYGRAVQAASTSAAKAVPPQSVEIISSGQQLGRPRAAVATAKSKTRKAMLAMLFFVSKAS